MTGQLVLRQLKGPGLDVINRQSVFRPPPLKALSRVNQAVRAPA
jgi:hypothetical protein